LRLPISSRSAGFRAECSRLSTAGSIAARLYGRALPRLPPGAPAFQRRAPLRRPCCPGSRSAPPGCSRLSTAGSIAARPTGSTASSSPTVLPPFNGGLHCGRFFTVPGADSAGGAPAFQRRAPLRQRRQEQVARRHRIRCSRLSTAGSIAADGPPGAPGIPAARVLPPFNGGLHCGLMARVVTTGRYGMLPPFNGGLHCGRAWTLAPGLTPSRCSRLSTAGSIAAGSA